MTTIAYSRSGSVQHEVDAAGSTPEHPMTFCGRNIGDRWTAREGEPNCQKCEAVSKQYDAALVANGPPPGWPPVKKTVTRHQVNWVPEIMQVGLEKLFGEVVAATPPARDVFTGSDDNELIRRAELPELTEDNAVLTRIQTDVKALAEQTKTPLDFLPPTTKPEPNPESLTTQYHLLHGTPKPGTAIVTPGGRGTLEEYYGPSTVIVRLADGSGVIYSYQTDEVRAVTPLDAMPKRKTAPFPVKRIRWTTR